MLTPRYLFTLAAVAVVALALGSGYTLVLAQAEHSIPNVTIAKAQVDYNLDGSVHDSRRIITHIRGLDTVEESWDAGGVRHVKYTLTDGDHRLQIHAIPELSIKSTIGAEFVDAHEAAAFQRSNCGAEGEARDFHGLSARARIATPPPVTDDDGEVLEQRRLTQWVAPELGCRRVAFEITIERPAERAQAVRTIYPIRVVNGVDESVFTVDAALEEVSSGTAFLRLEEHLAPETFAEFQATPGAQRIRQRLDQSYDRSRRQYGVE